MIVKKGDNLVANLSRRSRGNGIEPHGESMIAAWNRQHLVECSVNERVFKRTFDIVALVRRHWIRVAVDY